MPDQLNAMEAALRAVEAQKSRRTPAQQAHFEVVTRRNETIQEKGVRPVDGVTFGRGKRDAVSKRGSA